MSVLRVPGPSKLYLGESIFLAGADRTKKDVGDFAARRRKKKKDEEGKSRMKWYYELAGAKCVCKGAGYRFGGGCTEYGCVKGTKKGFFSRV